MKIKYCKECEKKEFHNEKGCIWCTDANYPNKAKPEIFENLVLSIKKQKGRL